MVSNEIYINSLHSMYSTMCTIILGTVIADLNLASWSLNFMLNTSDKRMDVRIILLPLMQHVPQKTEYTVTVIQTLQYLGTVNHLLYF
jgi:hypothetical protein